MKNSDSFKGSRVLVVGAGGGLGQALVQELESRGAAVTAGLRDPAKLPFSTKGGTVRIDLKDSTSIEEAAGSLLLEGPIDYVVCSAGVDVRKSIQSHTVEEIDWVLATDLRGPILLTKAFLPAMLEQGHGGFLFYGGFADGRLAFPYYSADVAARAGLRSFVESVNREIGSHGPRLTFFGPAVADTVAEKPYHDLWRKLGAEPVSTEVVAREAADALKRGDELHVMGGFLTRFFAKLNGWSPRAGDALLVKGYSKALKAAFGGTQNR
jgi:NAD(P)-dependent dehydrogenase (short-subunit alcohol dehydrogenase family)